jgi:hypothetical protein
LRKDAASPTAVQESIMITGVIEAKEERDIMTCYIPNAFIQALLPKKDPGEDRVVMKITGVLYVEVLKAIYGMLEAALLWYKIFRKDLEDVRFVFNPCDPCMANKKVQGSQQTILFHVDNLKLSHMLKSVNDRFEKWLNQKYGKHG